MLILNVKSHKLDFQSRNLSLLWLLSRYDGNSGPQLTGLGQTIIMDLLKYFHFVG